MTHPYISLLKDRHVRVLWIGLALSALGGELYRVGAIWLAAELAGPNASLLVTASSAAVLAVSILGGPLAEALPRRSFLIWTDLLSAAACMAVVAVSLTSALTFPMLVAISVLLGALGAASRPVFLSGLPSLVQNGELRAANGLFDSTIRLAQAGGPFLAAAVLAVAPAIHLLTANAVSFLASAGAVAAVGRRLDKPPSAHDGPKPSFFRRLARGVHAANGCPGVWSALITTGVRGGSYALGFTVGVPILFAQGEGGASGLAGVAIVFGAVAITELIAGPFVVLTDPKRPLRRQFEGYAVIGIAQTLVGAAALLDAPLRIPAMVAAALVMGAAHSVAGLAMLNFFSTRLSADDYAAVLRLRLVLVIGAMMATTALGPFVLPLLGPAMTGVICGVVATITALVSMFGRPARTLGPGFAEPDPKPE